MAARSRAVFKTNLIALAGRVSLIRDTQVRVGTWADRSIGTSLEPLLARLLALAELDTSNHALPPFLVMGVREAFSSPLFSDIDIYVRYRERQNQPPQTREAEQLCKRSSRCLGRFYLPIYLFIPRRDSTSLCCRPWISCSSSSSFSSLAILHHPHSPPPSPCASC